MFKGRGVELHLLLQKEQRPCTGRERAVGSQPGTPSIIDALSLRCVLIFKFETEKEIGSLEIGQGNSLQDL